jgi:pyruvate/2-oxoglutarate dehydrogenase complex dihydrolipoamide acyltransferase (E2) component
MSAGSRSRPSTHESQIGVAVESEEIHQELVVVSEVQSNDVRTEEAPAAQAQTEQAETQEEQAQAAQAQTEQAQTQEEERVGIDLIREFDANLHVIADPGCRIAIDRFCLDIRDEVKRAYSLKGPTQPRGHAFPKTTRRCFQTAWFDDYDWLEYSVSKDAAFYFYCFFI